MQLTFHRGKMNNFNVNVKTGLGILASPNLLSTRLAIVLDLLVHKLARFYSATIKRILTVGNQCFLLQLQLYLLEVRVFQNGLIKNVCPSNHIFDGNAHIIELFVFFVLCRKTGLLSQFYL